MLVLLQFTATKGIPVHRCERHGMLSQASLGYTLSLSHNRAGILIPEGEASDSLGKLSDRTNSTEGNHTNDQSHYTYRVLPALFSVRGKSTHGLPAIL